ncbi:uncharacterized protein [Dermacentor andersoni]|uniref:uncharacterized protein n=1 Tax=Dermacentor andersoni TaxID=34620 RepID=UPI003B3B2D69
MGNVISAATEDASDAGMSQLVVPHGNIAPATDTAAEWIQQSSQDEALETPLYRLYPSTETFGEQAVWSSLRDHESDSALPPSSPYSPEQTAAPSRPGPRLISAAPSVLAATRSLPSPTRLSPASDEEQRTPTPLARGSLPLVTELRSHQAASVGPSAASLSAPLSEATLTATRRFPPLARGLLVAGAVLWLVSALLALVTWRLSREPLGADLAQNVSALLRQLERLATGSAGGAVAASNDSVAWNLSRGNAAANRMADVVAAGGHEQPHV